MRVPSPFRGLLVEGSQRKRRKIKVLSLIGSLLVTFSLLSCQRPTPPPKVTTTISGRVTDAETGKPIAGAIVSTEPATQQVATGDDGRFLLEAGIEAAKTYKVNASKEGYFSNYATVKTVEGENRLADIQLSRRIAGISGTVTDATTGEPIPGVLITTDPISQNVTTDSNGRYVLDNLTKDIEYRVTASKEGYETVTITVKVIEDKKYQRGDIQLKRAEPKLGVSPDSLYFRKGQTSRLLTIRNDGTGVLEWSMDYPTWVSVSKRHGTTTQQDQVTVSVNRSAMPSGLYSGELTIRSNGGDKVVGITVERPQLSVDVKELDFGTSVDTLYFNISNSGTGSLDWTISEEIDWLRIDPDRGSATDEEARISVTVTRLGLRAGSYTGQIKVSSDGGDATIKVTLEVPQPDTEILSGPSEGEEVTALPVVFTFGGIGIEGPVQFSWRLNAGGTSGTWSDWSDEDEARLEDLDESALVGSYVFEVRSRSSAGDVDLTPAQRRFTVNAISGPSLMFSPRSLTVSPGSDFEIAIVVDEVSDLMLLHLVVGFNPSALEYITVDPEKDFLTKAGGSLVWPTPRIDTVKGIIDINAGVALSDPPGVSGTGILGRLKFRAKGPGISTVEFKGGSELRDHTNADITVRQMLGCEVVIE
ncbi:MAG TPA: hypothetical protein EYP53_01545 [Candidatus Latescibacteria bacterium]|nr:hypothetical protein [Candidatus Latescibacterota bacterium]